jgi:hypothetical protein
MKKLIQITIALLFYAVNAFPQALSTVQQLSTVTVKVTDEQGAVIARALVVLHADALERDNPKPFNLDVRTTNGEAKVILPSGFFDVFVASTGFAPHCEKLRVRDGKPAALRFVLVLDKLMANEYGDRF